jgi:MFS family permease
LLSPLAVAAQIPGGWAAQIYGGRIMLVISFALWSIASVLTPGSLAGGTRGVVAARVCVGVAQGLLIPAVHTVLSQVGAGRGARGMGRPPLPVRIRGSTAADVAGATPPSP